MFLFEQLFETFLQSSPFSRAQHWIFINIFPHTLSFNFSFFMIKKRKKSQKKEVKILKINYREREMVKKNSFWIKISGKAVDCCVLEKKLKKKTPESCQIRKFLWENKRNIWVMDRFLEQVAIEASQMYVTEDGRSRFANTVGFWFHNKWTFMIKFMILIEIFFNFHF
jgi:hypothetical protein